MSSTKTKKAFDFARNSMYSCDPIADLTIIGGNVLDADERGELDTDEDTSHPLYDGKRLRKALAETFIANIDHYGVLEPIVIAKVAVMVDGKERDVAAVVEGRTRVRAARVVNRMRAKRGEPALSVPAVIRRADETDLLGVMITGNEARADDDVPAKIEKLKRLMNRGVTVEAAAVSFNAPVSTLKNWLAFDDGASKALRKAVESGKLSVSAGVELVKIKEPEKQEAALQTALAAAPASGKLSVSKARSLSKKARKPAASDGIRGRELRKVLAAVQKRSHGGRPKEAIAWWDGFEQALQMVIGGQKLDELDSRVAEIIKTATEAK